ncbi:MAG: AEC family transporter [Pseudomonadota bacterium]
MTAIVDVVLPVFAIMLAGYGAGRWGALGPASSEALNGFVYYGALPSLFFVSMARAPLADAFDWPFLVAYGGGVAASFLLAVLVARWRFPNRPAAIGLAGITATLANTGYMGIPLLQTAYGEAAMLPAIVASVFNGAVMVALGIAIVEIDLGRGGGRFEVLRKVTLGVIKSPLVLAAVAGLAVSSLNLELPKAIATFCDIMGAAAGPCALFATGLFMVGRQMTAGAAEVGWLVALKLLVQPLVTWILAYHVLEMAPIWAASTVILSALPTGASIFVVAQRYGIYVQRSTAAIMASTVLSVITLSICFLVLEPH